MRDARYDGIADWYDERVHGDAHPSDCVVCEGLRSIDDRRPGLVVGLGCGTAAHWQAICSRDRRLIGVDISAQLLRIASTRLPATILGDARRPPLRPGSVDVVATTLHTDVASAEELFSAVYDLLRPEGTALVVGAHPCLNNRVRLPERDDLGVEL